MPTKSVIALALLVLIAPALTYFALVVWAVPPMFVLIAAMALSLGVRFWMARK